MNQNINAQTGDEEYELNKLKKEDAHVFSLPPMSSSRGHTTSDFTELIFKGKITPFCLWTLSLGARIAS